MTPRPLRNKRQIVEGLRAKIYQRIARAYAQRQPWPDIAPAIEAALDEWAALREAETPPQCDECDSKTPTRPIYLCAACVARWEHDGLKPWPEAETPPPPQTVCKCGHGVGVHTHNLRNEPKQYRHDCSHCACEAFVAREAAPPVAPPCRCVHGVTQMIADCPVHSAENAPAWRETAPFMAPAELEDMRDMSDGESDFWAHGRTPAAPPVAPPCDEAARLNKLADEIDTHGVTTAVEQMAVASALRRAASVVLRLTTEDGSYHQHAGAPLGRRDGECPTCGEE